MKRRVFSFVTALALCLNLCPVWAFAAVDAQDAALCPHHPEHTAECGYIPETPDAGCTFACRICPIEELIGKLPDSVSADNSEQVGEQLGEIFDLYDALTGEEQEQVDLSPCAALMDQLEELSAGALSDSSYREQILTQDEEADATRVVSYPLLFDTREHTLTNTAKDPNSTAIQVTGTGQLELRGTVVSQRGIGVRVESGGSLTVTGENTSITGQTYALDIASGAKVQLSAGTYTGGGFGYPAIHVEDGNFAALLAEGFTFFDTAGNLLSPDALTAAKTLTVGRCENHEKGNYTAVSGAPAHTWTCDYCGTAGTEPCTFDFVQDGDGTSDCADCGNGLAIVVDEDDLSDLVYDGTLKPEEVGVTVTLTAPGPGGTVAPLVKDKDFTVDIKSITDAGQATVTVTGITFHGAFVKTYTVAQDTPGIQWDTTAYTVNYDGSAVTAGELPNITITIKASEDLHPFLKYAYKKTGDADFAEGLPADAGTYQVKAYLEESQNYEAAETDPLLTLTINQITPIVMAPAATMPTYNRSPQELVTAGALDPVAVADGLEIQFATSQTGPWSATIPTGTNAGAYDVWYKLEMPAEVAGNYIAPDLNPAQVSDVEIQRKAITPVVTLSQYSYLYDGGYKEPTVTVKDEDRVTDLPDTEYKVEYVNNRNVSTDAAPAKVVVTDKIPNGGNYDLTQVEVEFKITSRTQDTLSITNKPATFTYGDKFTLQTSGGSGNGEVTWEIVPVAPDVNVATVDQNSGQVTITGHGSVTVKATKSGTDPATGVVNYEDATAAWTFTADKKPVTATVTAEDKDYDGNAAATVHAVVEQGVLPGDEITITGLAGTFDDENAGADKTVTVVTTGASITGHNSEHYAVTYSAATVKAAIHKAVAKITTAPVAANLTYNGAAQALIATGAVVDPNSVAVEYSLSETGPYSADFPKGTNAGGYTVWYRVQETANYTGLAPASVDVTIAKKQVSPTIKLSGDGLQTDSTATPPAYSYVYDGTAKEPVVTLCEAGGSTVIPAGEYTVAYSNNINVSTADTPATVTVTAKADGNYSFVNAPVTATFTINQKQAEVLTAPEAAGLPLTFNTFAQRLVTAGVAEGGTMVYRVGDTGDFEPGIPERTNAGTYKVYYKVQGDNNHSDSEVCSEPVTVTIAPKRVDNPTIELQNADGSALVSYTYDGTAKTPTVVVKDGSDIISAGEYNIVYSDNTDAGKATVNITDKPGGNYAVTGSAAFVINKADIVFNPPPTAATLTYNGTAQELLVPGTTTGGTVLYALNSATSAYSDAIPTGVNAGTYNVYYKVTGDKNHNDLPVQGPVTVTIQRKPLTGITIELTPNSFKYDGAAHLPAVTVKDGDTVLPASEYIWSCDNNAPTQGGTYTITVTDKTGGNYDLTGVVAPNNTATFTIGKVAQDELVIEGKPEQVYYGDSFKLTTSGGSGTGGLTWATVGGNAGIDTDGNVTIKGVGEVTINVLKAGDTNYQQTSAQWTFTAAPKPVTASVTVNSKPYDGNTTATVASADITADLVTVNGTTDTVSIAPASITAAFDTPRAGTGKTVTLDTSKVQVTGGDAAKYAISYPATVTADITQATTAIITDPAAIAPLTYSGQPQALVTAGAANVGFLVYSLDGASYSSEIPTGTDAGTYTVCYKVDGTADYTGVAANATPISVTIDPKPITPKIELSETSFLYDGSKKTPKVTVKDDKTVIDPDQYTVAWDKDLTSAGTHTVTISAVSGKNYTFAAATASVEITPAEQAALHITGKPEHVYYGDTITTLGTTGGTGNGTVKWSVTAGNATIEESTGKLTITGTGAVTVRAERSVPNYGSVGDNWNFTVEPKPVTAEVTVTARTYDGTTTIVDTAITASVNSADLVGGDTVTLSGLKGVYADANAGTGKTVTLDDTNATKTDGTGKYSISYPATAKGDINPKNVTVTVTLSDHDLKTDTNGQYYEYDGSEKKPSVIVEYDTPAVAIPASNYTVVYASNKNVGDATVTVTAKAGGNYTFDPETVNFEIRSAAAVLVSSPQAKDLTYEKGTQQELVTVGTATGGTVVYKLSTATDSDPNVESGYGTAIPKAENAGTYTVFYKVKGDGNHKDTAPAQVSATIKPKEITPTITLDHTTYEYDGAAKTPTVTVEDGGTAIDGPGTSKPEYSVSYRDNVNAGTATVIVSDANGGNYIVNGTATFEITKAAPAVTAPTGKTGLQYTGEVQELVKAGGSSDGTVVYSVNGGNYSAVIPTASAVGTYTIDWKVQGDGNHSDTTVASLTVKIDKNTVSSPTITLSQEQFTYDGNQHRPAVTVYDNNSRLIPTHEYTVSITGVKSNNMVDVDTYTVTIAAAANSNYEFTGTLTRTFMIVPADQETISITGTQAQVRYGDTIQLGVTGGTGSGTVTWNVAAKDGSTIIATGISDTGLLTVKDVNTPITVTVTRSRGGNYTDVSAAWEFTAAKKPVTAEVTVAAKNWDGTTGVPTGNITVTVKPADLAFTGDSITISGLTGTFDDPNVGTGKTVTLTGGTIGGTNADKYDVTIPATATASILGVAATVDTEPVANTLTYDASQTQALVTAGTATGGAMVYSLDGSEFTPNIPKGKDAGTYTVYFKAQGDQNHTDSEVKTVNVTITQQTVTLQDNQIELSPPSAQYDGSVKRPTVTVRDGANNVIPDSEYKVTYVTDGGANWKDQGTYTVKVENITGGNYVVNTATKDFTISTTAQAPLEITGKPGLVYYGDTFTLSATGGSGSAAVTWSVDNAGKSVVDIDANGFVTIKGTGSATITATKAGGGNYDEAKATYPLNALKKPVTAIVTADDKVFDGNDSATIHVTWKDGDLVGTDAINTTPLSGAFADEQVGTNKTVTITGTPVSDTISQKYDITIPATTTASITKADAAAPAVTANTLSYTGSAQDLVTGGDTSTLYSGTRDGIYTATVPTGTNAGSYTVWFKAKGDANHNESAPQAVEVTISPKTLTADASTVTLSGNDLKEDTSGTGTIYYYEYDGAEKTPSVVIKDGAAVIPSGEYTVTYSDNKNVTTADKKATVTITDNAGGNYTVSGSVSFEIRKTAAQLTGAPQDRNLTYNGQPQQLVTVGTATGGHIEYQLTSVPAGEPALNGNFSTTIPTGTVAGTYTVDYKLVGDDNHNDGPDGSVTVTIQPKTVISPEITVTGGPFTYNDDGTAHTPTVTVEDGGTTIDASEYTLSYRDNVNVGTATVIVTDNNGGNYTVNGTATFEIGKAAASVRTAPTGKTGLKYNGTAQELLATLGAATGGTLVYSLSETGEYSAAIPTGKAVGEYEIWYKVQGDANHSDTTPVALSSKVKIDKNTVANPTINVEPASVKYTGEKQEPTVTVKDDSGLTIDGSEYTVTYADTANNNNSDLTQVGTYTVTVTGKDTNYSFSKTATFTITPADQTALTITGTRERVYYGDTIPLGTTGGIDGGTVTWKVSDGAPASIDTDTGMLTITGTGSVTVTATSSKTGYADQTATWNLFANKKPVTALVTAASKTYDGSADAAVTATLQASDFVGADSFTITLTGCTFEDANAGTDKKVNVVSTNPTVNTGGTGNHENYAIAYPATATASIFKADVTSVTAPTLASGLTYTGLPLELIATAGSATGGAMEYSTDGINYSASLPTGTNAGDYDIWYRVKGDGNHNDVAGVKLSAQVTIAKQTVANPEIELTPNGATYDGQEHKPSVTVKDTNGRVIPDSEYTVSYGSTNWKDVGDHTVTVTGKTDGNYSITGTHTQTFTILPAGQSPLSIVGQPGEVRYGDVFTLSATGGSGTGAVTWETSDSTVAFVNSQTGRVEIKKAGGPVTVTARKAAGGGYGETTATWTFSAEKRPATAIVTARNKPYDGNTTATLDISWKDGDLLNGDTITLDLTGAFDDANVGANKIVRITRNGDLPDGGGKYAVTYNATTTASITATQATVSGVQSGPWTYSGGEISLLQGGAATNGTIVYSRNGVDFMETSPTETNAGRYTVYYKARGNTNYADSDVRTVEVTIQPKTVASPTIELSSDSFEYDGTPKEPDVIRILEGSNVIPASEYTVSYSNNVNVGTTARVTITDVAGGNYTVSGSKTFTIKAGVPALTSAPEAKDLTYTGKAQALVTAGSAINGKVVYSLDGVEYSATIPRATDADDYAVAYKVVDENGNDATTEDYVYVTISPQEVTPTILLNNQASYSVAYTGSAQTPAVTVKIGGETVSSFTPTYSNNTKVGTATVTVQSTGGNYKFFGVATFEITKGKASFLLGPEAKEDLVYTGEPQELVQFGMAAQSGLLVVYSTDNLTYLPAIPTGINRGNYVVIAKVQGNEFYEDSDPVAIRVTINKNVVSNPTVTLSSGSFPYTGGEQKPTVTVADDDGNVIDASEYTVTYSNNVNVGTATVSVKSKTNGNYSFAEEKTFTIVDASQTPLAITGKQDTVYYGDTLSLGATGGGSGTVTWSSSNVNVAEIDANGTIPKIKTSGSVTITATKGSSTDTWTFYAQPKPVTAVITAANKVYDSNTTATMTVTLSGLLSGDNVATNTDDGVKAAGQFADETVGTNKTVVITALTVPDAVSAKYAITHNSTTTASITPKPATVLDTDKPTLAGSLTYNGGAQPLLASGGTADSGNLMYSLDGLSYSYTIPTGTDAGTYTVWYKVEAADENHKDSAAVKLGTVTISANTDTPSVLCTPSTIQYDGRSQTPDVVVRDSAQRIIPESEYTVTLPANRIAVGKYKVTVTDKPGGNYEFTSPITVEDAFEIVSASQNPLSIVTDIPTGVHYGDTFRLSAMGGSGSGAVQWSVEGNENGIPATIDANGVVTVTGTGGFTVEAYRAASDGYSQSNTDSVPFVASPKPVTPVVTASDKSYDGKTDAVLTASWKSGDLVGTDTIALTVDGAFATADAGTGKRVNLTTHTATGTNADKYAITWPDSTTASIYKVDAKIQTAPADAGLTYTGSAQDLVTAGKTENNIGTVVYSTSQNGAYSETIPTGTNAGKYTVWYKVADSVNYTGIAPAAIEVEIKKADPTISTAPKASGTEGQKLSEIPLNGGATDVSGKFAWKDDDNVPQVGTSQQTVIFTPDDTANYNAVEFQIDVTIANRSVYRAPTRTTVQDGTATTVVSASDGSKLVQEAVANQSDSIVIKPEITGDVTKTEVTIPASTVSKIGSETDAALTVSAPIADVTIPNSAVEALSSAGSAVQVATEQVDHSVVLTLTADGETVESVPGGVTLTVPAADAGPGTVAVLVHEDGTRQVIQKSVAKDGAVSIPLDGSATVELVDNSKSFEDVPSDGWSADAVAFASARELFAGTGGNTFEPETEMSRSMLATVLYRLEGCPSVQDADRLSGVSGDAWYADSAAWAVASGITSTGADGSFNPDESVTREQFALMLWNYAGKPKASEEVLGSFEDAGLASREALEALYWAAEKGVLIGRDDGQLAPRDVVTRAEAAQMVKNFMENA